MCFVNILCQLKVKCYLDKVCIVEPNLEIKLKNHLYVCMNLVLCFDVNNSLLKFVEAF